MVTITGVRDRLRNSSSDLYSKTHTGTRRATKADLEAAAHEMNLLAQTLTTWLLKPEQRGDEEVTF